MDVVHCPTCGHAVPQGNLAMHQAMCVPTHCPPASSIRLSPRTTTTPSSSSSWCAPAARGGGLVTLTSPPPRVYAGRATMAAAAAGTTNSPGGILQVGDVVDLMQDDDDDNNNASSSDTTDESTWRCSRCTLDNRRQALHCEACQHPNPRVAAMPSSSSSSFLSPRWPVAHPVRNTHHHYATNRDEGGSFVRPPDAVRRDRLVEEPWYAEPHAISAAPPSSPLRYVVSGGALVGGVLGASGAYLRGHPVASSAMEGAVSGAVSGAVLHEFGRPRRTSAVTLGGRRPAPHGPPADTAVWQPIARMPVQRWQQMQQRPAYGGDRRRQSIDSMSYEQMLSAFGDGSDNLGASAGTISQLPTSVVEHVHSLPPDCQCCHICLESYERGDIRKTLPCLHGFHEACADKWLSTNGSCPVCKHRICTE